MTGIQDLPVLAGGVQATDALAVGRLGNAYQTPLGNLALPVQVGSIAALRANTAYTPVIAVLGYSTTGDGGEGSFVLASADKTSADNGGTIIVATDYMSRSEAVFRTGSLSTAVAGSMAIPGLFRSVESEGSPASAADAPLATVETADPAAATVCCATWTPAAWTLPIVCDGVASTPAVISSNSRPPMKRAEGTGSPKASTLARQSRAASSPSSEPPGARTIIQVPDDSTENGFRCWRRCGRRLSIPACKAW